MLISVARTIHLLAHGKPLLDVRSEKEYAKGSIPRAVNIPILNTAEHGQVGSCYKKYGQNAAIELGNHLVDGKNRKLRVQMWKDFFSANNSSALYCWRGGLRSQLAQQWLQQEGCNVPRVTGGYKSVRANLKNVLDNVDNQFRILLVGGLTGVGKTILLKKFKQSLDLEMLANHKGSVFGNNIDPQPSTADFENQVAVTLKIQEEDSKQTLIVEDESRNIGALIIPFALFKTMHNADVIIIESPFEERLESIYQEYIVANCATFKQRYPDTFVCLFSTWLMNAFDRIRNRLGGSRYQDLIHFVDKAIKKQKETGELSYHQEWLRKILTEYYDPMYKYQLKQKKDRIIYTGQMPEVANFIQNHLDSHA